MAGETEYDAVRAARDQYIDTTLTAAHRATARAGFGQPVTTSAGTVKVVYPRGTGPGNRQRLQDALRLEGLDPYPTVNGECDGFAVESR